MMDIDKNDVDLLEDGEIVESSDGEDSDSSTHLDVSQNSAVVNENSAVIDEDLVKKCQICEKSSTKYRCPACELRTCSLECCKKHKIYSGCDGSVKRSRMVPLNKFDNFTLLNDYRFLEEANRVRLTGFKEMKDSKTNSFRRDKRKANKLGKECFRRSCKLHFMPPYFDKSQRNTSFFDPIADTIFWKITWVFVDANSLKIETDRNPETVTIFTLLKQIVNPKPNSDYIETAKSLTAYSECGLMYLKCFIKVENNHWTKDNRYYELDLRSNIKDNLRNKILYEYPLIYVLLPNGSKITSFKVLSEEAKNEILAKRIWEKTPTATTFEQRMFLIKEAEKICHVKDKNSQEIDKNGQEIDKNAMTTDSTTISCATSSNDNGFKPLKRLLPLRNRKNPNQNNQNRITEKQARQNFRQQKQEMIKELAEKLAGGPKMSESEKNEVEISAQKSDFCIKTEPIEQKTMIPQPSDFNDKKVNVVKTNFFGLLGGAYDSETDSNSDSCE